MGELLEVVVGATGGEGEGEEGRGKGKEEDGKGEVQSMITMSYWPTYISHHHRSLKFSFYVHHGRLWRTQQQQKGKERKKQSTIKT